MTSNNLSPTPNGSMGQYSKRTLILGLMGLLVVAETVFSGAIVGIAKYTGRDYSGIASQLYATRILMSPFVGPHPIEKATGARYLGHYTNRNSKDYYPADGLRGWRLANSVAIVDTLNEYMAAVSEFREDGKPVENWRFTNDQGFMTSGELRFHYELPKPAGVYRIIVVGGSTVEGVGADGYQNTLTSRLSARLKAMVVEKGLSGPNRIEVINAGVGAYHSALEYLYMVSDLVKYQPDLVIAYNGNNDAIAANWEISSPGRSPFRTETHLSNAVRANKSYTLGGAADLFIENLIPESLRFASRFSLGFTLLKLSEYANIWLSPDSRPVHFYTAPPFSPKSVTNYQNNLERMAFLAQQYKFKFAAMLQPTLGVDGKINVGREKMIFKNNTDLMNVKKQFYAGARKSFSAMQRKYLGNKAVCIADLNATVFRGLKIRVYADNSHLLGSGNDLVAEKMLGELMRCGFLPISRRKEKTEIK
jgi:hypothetical protein